MYYGLLEAKIFVNEGFVRNILNDGCFFWVELDPLEGTEARFSHDPDRMFLPDNWVNTGLGHKLGESFELEVHNEILWLN